MKLKIAAAMIVALSCLTSLTASAQGFRFERDDRGNNAEGKRASCDVYGKIARVQAEANREYRCGYRGGQWETDARAHSNWCRFVRRETLGRELRERSEQLQNCFNRLGDFDDDRWDRRR